MFWNDASLSHLPRRRINLPACHWLHLLPPPLHMSLPVSPCAHSHLVHIVHRAAAANHLCSSIRSRSTTRDTNKLMSEFEWRAQPHIGATLPCKFIEAAIEFGRHHQPSLNDLLFFLFILKDLGEDFYGWIIAGCWQTASQMLDQRTLRDNVIGCTRSLLPCSLWTYQSSLTYVFKAVVLAACSSCHGNPNAISPHCFLPLDILKAFFFFFFLLLVY